MDWQNVTDLDGYAARAFAGARGGWLRTRACGQGDRPGVAGQLLHRRAQGRGRRDLRSDEGHHQYQRRQYVLGRSDARAVSDPGERAQVSARSRARRRRHGSRGKRRPTGAKVIKRFSCAADSPSTSSTFRGAGGPAFRAQWRLRRDRRHAGGAKLDQPRGRSIRVGKVAARAEVSRRFPGAAVSHGGARPVHPAPRADGVGRRPDHQRRARHAAREDRSGHPRYALAVGLFGWIAARARPTSKAS